MSAFRPPRFMKKLRHAAETLVSGLIIGAVIVPAMFALGPVVRIEDDLFWVLAYVVVQCGLGFIAGGLAPERRALPLVASWPVVLLGMFVMLVALEEVAEGRSFPVSLGLLSLGLMLVGPACSLLSAAAARSLRRPVRPPAIPHNG